MKCEKAIDRYLQLDQDNPVPLSLKMHFLVCRQCSKETQMLRNAYSALQKQGPFKPAMEDAIMAQIALQERYSRSVSDFNWAAAGIIIACSIVSISYSDALQWLYAYFGTKIIIPLYLVMGILIAGYISSYVASHLNRLQKIAQNLKSLL